MYATELALFGTKHSLNGNNFEMFVSSTCSYVQLARPRTLLIAHRVQQRPHESFYPGSTSEQKSIKPNKNLIVYELFKFLS